MSRLAGKSAIVTAGPTAEPIDPVRVLTNRSSGKQGFAIAAALAELGARVTLVAGPVAVPTPKGVRRVDVETAREMLAACEKALPADIAVCVAAVSDWRPETVAATKTKKTGDGPPTLSLVENPDILATLSRGDRRPRLVVGFAAETHEVEDYAQAIPEQTTEHLQALEMQQTPASYRQFLHHSYFPNWQAEYERYVEQFARTQSNPDYPHLAKVSAQTYQMIYHGPILEELPLLKVPTLLIIGQADRTVFGRRFAPPEAVRSMGNFPALGRAAQQRIPASKLLEFEGVGHVAHLEVPERFNSAVLAYLKAPH